MRPGAAGLVGRRIRVGRKLDETPAREPQPQEEGVLERRAERGVLLERGRVGMLVLVPLVRHPVGVPAVDPVRVLALELVELREPAEAGEDHLPRVLVEVGVPHSLGLARGPPRRIGEHAHGEVVHPLVRRLGARGVVVELPELPSVDGQERKRVRLEPEQRPRIDREEARELEERPDGERHQRPRRQHLDRVPARLVGLPVPDLVHP